VAESIYGDVVLTLLAQLFARSRANYPNAVIPGEAKRRPGTAGSAAFTRRSRIGALRACPG